MSSTATTGGGDLRRVRQNLTSILGEMAAACTRAGRALADVKLLPVTKYVGVAEVELIRRAGLREIGESTVQETLRKRASIDRPEELTWHLIGHLQRNKVPRAVEIYDVIHSLDSMRLAQALDRRLRDAERRPRIFLEVNVAAEITKHGVPPADAIELLERIREETSIGDLLCGLMTVAPHVAVPEDARPHFRLLREIRDGAVGLGLLPEGAELSMGMSNDFPIALEEGATIVRIGSRLFEGLEKRDRR